MAAATALLAATSLVGLGSTAPPVRRAVPRRGGRLNIVLILSDDQRADSLSVMPQVRHLLGDEGVTFDNFHVTTSDCCPSRASILTGQYSHHTGVTDNFGLHSYPSFDERSNLAVWLHRAGYETALVGKYLNDYTIYGFHEHPRGWDDWIAVDSVPEEKYYDYTLNENGTLVHYGRKPSDYSTSVLTRKAVRFLRRTRAPFFLYFAPTPPHLPALPAPRDRGSLLGLPPLSSPAVNEADLRDKPWRAFHRRLLRPGALVYTEEDVRRRQLETLRALDRSVAQIVATLRRRRELDRTVILYSSDNGFLWGEHRLGGKLWPYEESTHVPLVVRTPWRRADGASDRQPVLNIDLASTITDLAGTIPGKPQDGRSFVPLLHGRRERWRKDFVVEYLGRKQLREGGPPKYVGLHTPRFLYVEYLNGWRELYDHRTDPAELRNVADAPGYVRIRRSLHRKLVQLYSARPRPAPKAATGARP